MGKFKAGNRMAKSKPTMSEAVKAMDDNDLDGIKRRLVELADEYLNSDVEVIKFRAWRELLKFCFPQKREIEGGGNTTSIQIEEMLINASQERIDKSFAPKQIEIENVRNSE